jgi:hypothetical protein
MHYFIHVVTDQERIIDPEGAAFPDLHAAKEEAAQSARDLMAEELRCGRPMPVGWRVQIADTSGTIVHAIPFMTLLFGNNAEFQRKELGLDMALVERAKATFARVRRNHSEINDGLNRLKGQLRTLSEFNVALGDGLPSERR